MCLLQERWGSNHQTTKAESWHLLVVVAVSYHDFMVEHVWYPPNMYLVDVGRGATILNF